MKNRLSKFVLLAGLLFTPMIIHAAGDLTAQQPITMTVSLGSKSNALRFYPTSLIFETGKLYKLVITNPSQQKHYFSSEKLSRSVFTRKVQIMGENNSTLTEVKGTISEIEVYPGGTAEWWFVPVKTMQAGQLHCSIKGHTEAGMIGEITIR